MPKNRKNRSAAVRFGPAIKALFVCLVLAVSGIGYVGLKREIHGLSGQIQQKEKHRNEKAMENQKLSQKLNALQTPPALHARALELNLGLQPPQPSQIVRLAEPVMPVSMNETAVEMAGRLQLASGKTGAGPNAH